MWSFFFWALMTECDGYVTYGSNELLFECWFCWFRLFMIFFEYLGCWDLAICINVSVWPKIGQFNSHRFFAVLWYIELSVEALLWSEQLKNVFLGDLLYPITTEAAEPSQVDRKLSAFSSNTLRRDFLAITLWTFSILNKIFFFGGALFLAIGFDLVLQGALDAVKLDKLCDLLIREWLVIE